VAAVSVQAEDLADVVVQAFGQQSRHWPSLRIIRLLASPNRDVRVLKMGSRNGSIAWGTDGEGHGDPWHEIGRIECTNPN
jgi:hypothetical protein